MLRKEASPDWAAPLFSKATCGNPRIMRKTNSSASYARMTTPENHPADSVTRGQLRFLLHLSETQKLSRTADVLGLSLSAASRTLEKLRAAFDDPLFTPHARGLKPTDALRRILPELRRTLEQADRLFAPPKFDPKSARGRFRIASRGLITSSLLAYLLARTAEEAPHLVIEHHHRTGSVWEDLESGRIDLAVVTDRSIPPAFRTAPLFDIKLGILLRSDHPLRVKTGGRAPALADFLSYRRLAMSVSSDFRFASWDRQLAGENPALLEPVAATSSSSIDLAATLSVSDFLMITPKRGAEAIAPYYGLAWMPLPLELQAPVRQHGCLVWTEMHHRDPLHVWVRRLIRGWARSGMSETSETSGTSSAS